MLSRIKVWSRRWDDSPFFDVETRIYVDMEDGRSGCYYLTGNPYVPEGKRKGKLTAEEWTMAESLAFWDDKWHTLHAGEIAKLLANRLMREVAECLPKDF